MHVPVVHELGSLSLREIFGRLPIQIRDFLGRADVFAGVAMAIQAEGHAQRLQLAHFVELIDLPVAMHATDPSIHVDRVVEINEVRHLVDLHPRHWRVVRHAQAHRQQARIARQHLAMAIHAHA